MGVTRRNFVKFAIGGVAGLHLTPLPYKLMDDIAIWTQNWPWVPVPPEGEFLSVKSVCGLCPGGCGIQVRKVDERAVKIEGRTDYPVNPGGICPSGMGGLQLLYDRDLRHTGPMKRVGPRGSGDFMEITWDEAIKTVAERIASLRKNAKTEALVSVDGNSKGSTLSLMIERLTKAAGSPNYVRMPSLEDTYEMGNLLMMGNNGPMAYDLENSDYVLSFGSGLLEGWGGPGRIMNAWAVLREKASKGGATVVQIESRASNTASKSDKWIAARPGTDAALALGIAHVIIRDNLYDQQFVSNYTSGFEKFKTMVLGQYSPEKIVDITGVGKEAIKAMADGFARAKAPVAIYGKGKGTLNGSLFEFMSVQALNALKGNINKPGGIIISDPLPLATLPAISPDGVAERGILTPRFDQAGTNKYPFAVSLINNLIDVINHSDKSPVDTLLVFSANPAFTLPDSGEVNRALKKIPFIVSFSPFRDETSFMADLVLPDHSYLEKTDDIVRPNGLQYQLYGLTRPVVKPVYNTRSAGDTIINIAKAVDTKTASSFPWKDYESVLKIRAKGLFDSGGGLVRYKGAEPAWKWKTASDGPDYKSFGDMWKKIKTDGLWYRKLMPSAIDSGIFKTASNRFEFFISQLELAVKDYPTAAPGGNRLKELGITVEGDAAFMPHYEGNHHHDEQLPLTMAPYEMVNLASGWAPSPPFAYKTIFDDQLLGSDSFAIINPGTASEFRIKQGDYIIIQSKACAVKARASLSHGAMPGVVYMPLGFGHTAYDEFIREKGVNPNLLIPPGKDPLSGHPVWWTTPVKIMKG
ncbi:Molybdopterin oxidoreductase [uncultured Desulfobacterium sp.]|uniref:Molybdopterin oxidoreductase n=1 Tax=uncultured Desulfobacterium sp. TaxID=201089 RepID=A0A445MW16_9BACT|nr:Molybdopterin oxidoreductase [uncultured Desulfobacterium sp.]